MKGAGLMIMETGLFAVALFASRTWIANPKPPTADGTPLMAPVNAFKSRPVGSSPMGDQVNGGVPPLAMIG
jgi:hypothetical protein